MIKSKTGGNSVKFSSTPTGSRTVSREQSIQAARSNHGSQAGNEDEEDEIIAPPKSRTRAEREAEATPAPEEEAMDVEAEEEEEELPDQSWGAMMGYTQVEEEDYGYNDMGDDDW
jgi:transcription factor IIIB subunit 2